jgi:arylsulfatase
VVRRLADLWLAEAGRNQVLPIDDGLVNRVAAIVPPAWPPLSRRVFVPGGGPVADECLPLLMGGFRIGADVTVPDSGASGVLAALGDWNGGWALYVLAGRLAFCFSRAGEALRVIGSSEVPPGRHDLSVTYRTDSFTLWYDDAAVASMTFRGPLPFALQHGGAGLRLGHDRGFPVCDDYEPPATWTGALHQVVIEAAGPADRADIRGALHAD